MTGPLAAVIGALLLIGVLVWAVVRPRGWSEAVVAVPAAGCVLALGLVSPTEAPGTLREFGPALAFLVAVLVLAGLADAEGVFRWLGLIIARQAVGTASGSTAHAGSRPGPRKAQARRRSPVRLLGVVFVVASATTAVLSLDATVVLLTPAVITAVRHARARPDPALYATAHLSNTASLLLPVSNLTNLLAFHLTGLTFLHFAGLMLLPFAVCIALEYLVFRAFFAADLRPTPRPDATDCGGERPGGDEGARDEPAGGPAGGDAATGDGSAGAGSVTAIAAPRWALSVLAAVLAGFALTPLAGVPAYLVAIAGAGVLAVPALGSGRIDLGRLVGAASPLFVLFVAALLIVVEGAVGHGPVSWLAARLPDGTALPSLAVLSGVGALLACLINNLPATLVLLAALGPHPAAGAVLAVLIGVNIGPNLTYTGSLALLLWRRVLHRHAVAPSVRRFTVLGSVTVPLCLVAGTAALWLALQV